MFFKVLNKGMAGSNTYILGDKDEAVVIDVGNDPDEIFEEAVIQAGMRVKYIILTHGHFDHMMYLDELERKTNAKVVIHEEDAGAFQSVSRNVSDLFGIPRTFRQPDLLVKEGSLLQVGDLQLQVLHTPGHTPGGICLLCGKMLFTGDTLFDGDFGRTDLPLGDSKALRRSIERLFQLPGDLMVYPGHDSSNRLQNIIYKCRAERLLDEIYWMESLD